MAFEIYRLTYIQYIHAERQTESTDYKEHIFSITIKICTKRNHHYEEHYLGDTQCFTFTFHRHFVSVYGALMIS